METIKNLFTPLHPNTELAMDIKLLTRKPGRLPEGKSLFGFITRDNDTHMTFEETVVNDHPKLPVKRNTHLYYGKHITVTICSDGTPRLNFKHLTASDLIDINRYALEVCDEIRIVLSSLIEKE